MPVDPTPNLAAFAAGDVPTATQLDTWHDGLDAMSAARTAYTPVWASSGTAPVLNNGTITGRYTQFGKFVWFAALLTLGSTSTIGTGAYSLSLPVASVASGLPQIVDGLIQDSSAGTTGHFPCAGVVGSGSSVVTFNNVNQAVGAAFPMTWASTDLLIASGIYEAA